MKSIRERILETAEELFMSQGYKKTSTRQIAGILGITQPNLYHHFRKKEDIYVAIMEKLSKEVYENLEIIRKRGNLPFDTLESMMIYLHQRHPFDFNTMMHDINHNLSKDVAEDLYHLWQNSYLKPFMALFLENKSLLRENIDINTAVRHLFILLTRFMEPEWKEKDIQKDLRIAIDMYLYGILMHQEQTESQRDLNEK